MKTIHTDMGAFISIIKVEYKSRDAEYTEIDENEVVDIEEGVSPSYRISIENTGDTVANNITMVLYDVSEVGIPPSHIPKELPVDMMCFFEAYSLDPGKKGSAKLIPVGYRPGVDRGHTYQIITFSSLTEIGEAIIDDRFTFSIEKTWWEKYGKVIGIGALCTGAAIAGGSLSRFIKAK